jgi:hypothetical protein
MELDKVRGTLETTGDHFEHVMFENGRGVSIIRHKGSYGGRNGLFELAVLDSEGEIDYSTPVCGDVLGWLSVDEVLEAMRKVAALPPATQGLAGPIIAGELAD